MARSKKDNELISYKVSKLQREGFGLDQARAIAFRMYRDGELRGSVPASKPKKKTTSGKRRVESRTRRASYRDTRRRTQPRTRRASYRSGRR